MNIQVQGLRSGARQHEVAPIGWRIVIVALWLALANVANAMILGPHFGLPKCDENFTPECVDPNLTYLERPASCKDSLVSSDRREFHRHAPRGFGMCETVAMTSGRPRVVVEVPDAVPIPPAGFDARSEEPCPPLELADGTFYHPPEGTVAGPHAVPPQSLATGEPRGITWACTYDVSPQPIPLRPSPIPPAHAGQSGSGSPPCGGTPNPCNPANGNKFRSVPLHTHPIPLTLFYNSYLPLRPGFDRRLGPGWSHTYSARIYHSSPEARHVDMFRADGRYVRFERQPDDTFLALGDPSLTLRRVEIDGELAWVVSRPQGEREVYWAKGEFAGRLRYVEDPVGWRTEVVLDWRGQVHEVVGPFGHRLRFVNEIAAVRDIVDPSGGVIRFGYREGLLTSVTHQDGSRRTFFYDDPHFADHLTAVADETMDPDSAKPALAARRHARFTYYPPEHPHAGKVRTSELAPVPGAPVDAAGNPIGQERVTLTYGRTDEGLASTTVVDARGHRRTIVYPDVRWRQTPVQIEYEIDGRLERWTFAGQDQYNRAARITDPRGSATAHIYSRDHRRSRTEALGDPANERVTAFEYLDPTSDLVTTRTQAGVHTDATGTPLASVTTTEYVDDPNQPGGKLPLPAGMRITGFDPSNASPISREARLVWELLPVTFPDSDSDGHPIVRELRFLTRIDGPRTDVEDHTTFAYYRDCPTEPGRHCGRLGQIRTVTDAAGQVIEYLRYDASARLLRRRAPNGLITENRYDARGRLIAVRELIASDGGETLLGERRMKPTRHGEIAAITSAEGVSRARRYDAAGQLVEIRDDLGNTIEFEYDASGNQTKMRIIEWVDGAPVLRYLAEADFDGRDRTVRIKRGGSEGDFTTGSVVEFGYDAASNLERVSDPGDDPST